MTDDGSLLILGYYIFLPGRHFVMNKFLRRLTCMDAWTYAWMYACALLETRQRQKPQQPGNWLYIDYSSSL